MAKKSTLMTPDPYHTPGWAWSLCC